MKKHILIATLITVVFFLITAAAPVSASPDFTRLPGCDTGMEEDLAGGRFVSPAYPVGCYNPVEPSAETAEKPAPKPAAVKDSHKKKSLASRGPAWSSKLIRTAMRFLGTPYSWGGTGGGGFDCSGFVMRIFAKHGINLEHDALCQFNQGKKVPKDQLSPGDAVFFSTYAYGPSHVGIYIGGGKFIHSSSSYGVRIDSLSQPYYQNSYVGARRY
ncbi:MAG: C40 family peptidase [Chloroflexi bacterium]|nr:C40 family peptidase [Chloroflexota bacterium]